jgi:hypothetical protein
MIMKLSLVFVGVLVAYTAVGAQTKLAAVQGMAGCWERRDDDKKLFISEHWMSPAGTSILGMGRTVKNGRTTDWEYMRIDEREDGLYFVARPRANNEETSFKLISTAPNSFVFENKSHDFPQRVIYKVQGDALTGRIEGLNNGKEMGIDFPMRRVKCP